MTENLQVNKATLLNQKEINKLSEFDGSLVKKKKKICLPVQIRVGSLGGKDVLEKERATHSSILA